MRIQQIFRRFKWRFLCTFSVILIEAGLAILFPLFIGFAIDDVLRGTYGGSIYLGILGALMLVVGAGRRFFDSRFYAHIFQTLGSDITAGSSIGASKKTARLNMMAEILAFFEDSVPSLASSVVGLVGTLIIIATLHQTIFLYCLLTLVIVFAIYATTRNKTVRFNYAYNNEMERQVDVISANRPPVIRSHLKNLMRWNIRLSDLETINFSLAWLVMMIFLVFSIILAVDNDIIQYGAVFALIMYLFAFIESVIALPLYYQQWLRLVEISDRLRDIDS